MLTCYCILLAGHRHVTKILDFSAGIVRAGDSYARATEMATTANVGITQDTSYLHDRMPTVAGKQPTANSTGSSHHNGTNNY